MAYFDPTIPADTEGVKLGAQRIREVKSSLNPLIASLFTDAGVLLTNWVTSLLLQSSTTSDTQRAVGANHIQSGAVTLRSLLTKLFTSNGVGRGYFNGQIITTPLLSADITLTSTSTAPVIPVVGGSVVVTTVEDPVAAGVMSSGNASSIQLTTSASFVQPAAIGSTVVVSFTADPVTVGLTVGARLQTLDGSGVSEYAVTVVTSTTATLSLTSIGTAYTLGSTVPSGVVFQTVHRTLTIVDGSGLDLYNITAATSGPNTVTLTLVSIGGTNTPGTSTIPVGTSMLSLGAVLSADAAGRARMAAGFFAPGNNCFQNSSIPTSALSTSSGVLPDGFVKAKLTLDGTVAARIRPISATVDSVNNYINVSSHGIVDATSLATVQPVVFFNPTVGNPDTGTLGPLSAATIYFARVVSANVLAIYTTAAAAWAATGRVVFSSSLPSGSWNLGYIPISAVGTNLNCYVAPLDIYSLSGGTALTRWCGYRFYFQTPFGASLSYTPLLDVSARITGALSGFAGGRPLVRAASTATGTYVGGPNVQAAQFPLQSSIGGLTLNNPQISYVDAILFGTASTTAGGVLSGDLVPFPSLDNVLLPCLPGAIQFAAY